MKVIFLDIDGVLNNQIWLSGWKDYLELTKGNIDHEQRRWFDHRCVNLLNELTEETEAKIVVSSSWRNGRSLEDLQKLFKEIGIEGEVIGKTPQLYFNGLENYNYSVPRGCEIKAWLETNKSILGEKMSRLKYVIFDDDSDMLYWQRNNFLWVDPYSGLTPSIIYKAKLILNA